MELMILTGMSGSGKSLAADCLEDMGYYCVDNMPAELIPIFAELYTGKERKLSKVAFVIDVRADTKLEEIPDRIDELRAMGISVKVVFIDCSREVLLNRYKETRRIHPLVADRNIPIAEALDTEREMLRPLKEKADYIIDTTTSTPHQLKDKMGAILRVDGEKSIVVNCMSFGFKYGVPADADLVFDVRCFPNPFYIPELKNLTGKDGSVSEYVFSFEESQKFYSMLESMLDYLLPMYVREGKTQLIIAFGCSGGKHRSVAFAERIGAHLLSEDYNAVVSHRDIIKKFEGDK